MKTATHEIPIPETLLRAAAEAEQRQKAVLHRVLTKLTEPEQRRTETEDRP